MDPATAFSIACGIVNLIQFGIEVGKEGYEIYGSPSALTARHEHLDRSAHELQGLCGQLQSRLENIAPHQTLTDEDQRIFRTAKECAAAASELHDLLSRLKTYDRRSKRQALTAAFKGRWERGSIEAATRRLGECQSTVDTALLARLSERIDLSNSRQSEIIQKLNLSAIERRHDFQELSVQLQRFITNSSNSTAESVKDGSQTRTLLKQIQLETFDQRRLQTLLDSLFFPAIYSREETIEDAFADTFQWIFDPSEKATRPWHNFVQWLREPADLYWVNGKAGSGKSTLMSYVLNRPQLREHLNVWARQRGSKLAILHHFFWRNGTLEQRSKSGLLRTLIRQLLSMQPTLVSALDIQMDGTIPPWTEARLAKCLDTLLVHASSVEDGLRIAVFVDGLDEFEGGHANQAELSEVVKRLCRYQHVKICVSSRPEQAYQDAFQSDPQLRLQDLTRDDLEQYVHGQLSKMPHFRDLRQKHRASVDQILEAVCRDADGVFLWARLVTQDLKDGLVCGDSIDMLQARLEQSDKTLDGLFCQFLDRIHIVHRYKTAKYLQVMTLKSDSKASLLEFLLVDQDDLVAMLPGIVGNKDEDNDATIARAYVFRDAGAELKRHLVARCAGLLTVDETPCSRCLSGDSGEACATICRHYDHHTRVGFIHRSAHDFLTENPAAHSFFKNHSINATQVGIDIARALLEISSCPALVLEDFPTGNWQEWARQMLQRLEPALQRLEDVRSSTVHNMIDQMNDNMSNTLAYWKQHHPEDLVGGSDAKTGWVDIMEVSYGHAPRDVAGRAMAGELQDYAMHKLRQCPQQEQKLMATYLLSCVSPWGVFRWTSKDEKLERLIQLLEYGADVNSWCGVGYTRLTYWQFLVMEMASTLLPRDVYGAYDADMSPSNQRKKMRRVTRACLDAGADLGAVWTFALQVQDPLTSIDLDDFVLFYVYEAGWIIDQLDKGVESSDRLQHAYPICHDAQYPRVKAIGTKGGASFRHLEDLERAAGIYEEDASFTPTLDQSVALGKLVQRYLDADHDQNKKAEAGNALMKELGEVYAQLFAQKKYITS